jgi:septal ring factor EnvC (AmiA/AmiB activator)
MRRKITLVSVLAFFSVMLFAQQEDKAKLEKERQEIQKEIKVIQAEFDNVKNKKKQILGQFNLIDRKIKLQNKYISNISRELRFIDDDIYMSNLEIYRLSKVLDTLKSQYSRSVVYAYKNRSNYDFLNFIFSANSFNDAIKRITYLKSYRAYREQQVNTIKETQQLIAKRKEDQIGKKRQKDEALKNQAEQAKVLEVQKKEKDVVLSQLKAQEKDLDKQLAAKRKKDRDLQNAITSIINREIAAARAAAKKKADEEAEKNPKPVIANPGNSGGPVITSTKPNVAKETVVFNSDADLKMNAGFENNRARLPWPVDQGYVCIHFGPYTVGETKLKGDNPGITICTPQPGTNVKAVFEGEVVSVFNIGDSKSVMIRHGKYFTVYSNLSSVNVAKGANVNTSQLIGKVAADEEDGEGGKLEFLMMIENKKVNPESWLRR